MRAFVALLVLGVGINSFASGRVPESKIHVWACSDVKGGIDHGFSVAVDNVVRKGLVASVSMQSIIGPQAVGSWKVVEANPTVARGNWVYLDSATKGGNFRLTINPAGAGKFSAKDKQGNPRSGALHCFRTRGL